MDNSSDETKKTEGQEPGTEAPEQGDSDQESDLSSTPHEDTVLAPDLLPEEISPEVEKVLTSEPEPELEPQQELEPEVEKDAPAPLVAPEKKKENKELKASKPSTPLSSVLSGEKSAFVSDLKPYLPQELVGGTLAHIPGTEDEAVWNAAAQSCGTEKVHFCYSIDEGRIWYLACPSSSLSSNPDSWCPLAAALPGNSEYWDKETVYLFEHEGIASALRWDPETGRMQVFLGASRTILPRVQSMDANFVTINPEIADIVVWKNMQLRTEQLSRATVRVLIYTGLFVCLVAAAILFYSYFSIMSYERSLAKVKQDTDNAALDLMMNASNVMQSDTIKHMVRIQELLDQLAKVNGTLVRYEVNDGKVEWEALVPQAFAEDFGKAEGLEKDGRVRVKNNR